MVREFISNMSKIPFYITVIMILALLPRCELVNNGNSADANGNNGNNVAVGKFCLSTGDIAGWTSDTCMSYDQEELFLLIDGSASYHEAHGLVSGILQNLTHSGGQEIEAYISDFGNAESAKSMYANKKADALKIQVLPSFDSAVAVLDVIGETYMLYAHVGKFFFELTFENFDTKTLAMDEAETFLNYYTSLLK